MATYLQNWVQSSKDLPAELVRCFKLMQELDQRSHQLQQSVNRAAEQLLAKGEGESGSKDSPKAKRAKTDASSGSPPQQSRLKLDDKAEADIAEVLRIADEKVDLAHQIYDHVDKHICSLDKDLRNFDTDLQNERSRLGLPDPQYGGDNRRRKSRGSEAEVRRNARDTTPLELATTGGGVTQVDPNEPTYCYCERVSFGEMIGCDNPDCAIEWFHFECVGITLETRPKGKWYCNTCSALKRAGKIE